jgi:hypothetical protein
MFRPSVMTRCSPGSQSRAGTIPRTPCSRPTPLSACLGAAFALAAPAAGATTVSNCNDSGPGSLRAVVGNAVNMDTVDLSQLNGCTITLTTGEIKTSANNLTLTAGNGAINAVTIDGGLSSGHHNRVLLHTGTGTLSVEGLVITDAKYNSGPSFQGGCILSAGSVSLTASTVSSCTVFDASAGFSQALGGGIYAGRNVSLLGSKVSGNVVLTTGNYVAAGGGIFSNHGDVTILYSSISNNSAISDGTGQSNAQGGGVVASANLTISYSTVSGNQAQYDGGIMIFDSSESHAAVIANSTISGNSSSSVFVGSGGVDMNIPLTMSNSTVAFNTTNSAAAGGLFAAGTDLQSSIIADNTSGGLPNDFRSGSPITGANNLIFYPAVILPASMHTIVGVCPRLLPLADNGGAILTHALRDSSPAIDKGNNLGAWAYDERGQPFSRIFASQADIGAYEWHGNLADRIFNTGFELGCDE